MSIFSRTELLIGKQGIEKLQNAKVAIFGIGGVGSFVVESLVRAGIGEFLIIDNDTISESNINRQIIATTKTIGKYKVEVMKERMLEINPKAKVEISKEFYLPKQESNLVTENTELKLDNSFSYIVDAIDTVTAKIGLIEQAKKLCVPIISSMGTGNKLNPTEFKVADIYKTNICPLAKTIRKELRKRNIDSLKVVYSEEEPIKPQREFNKDEQEETKRQIPGSISFVPSVVGLIIASEVVKDIINN